VRPTSGWTIAPDGSLLSEAVVYAKWSAGKRARVGWLSVVAGASACPDSHQRRCGPVAKGRDNDSWRESKRSEYHSSGCVRYSRTQHLRDSGCGQTKASAGGRGAWFWAGV